LNGIEFQALKLGVLFGNERGRQGPNSPGSAEDRLEAGTHSRLNNLKRLARQAPPTTEFLIASPQKVSLTLFIGSRREGQRNGTNSGGTS
jgi:hypothetical protein